ncbi:MULTISPECIES: peroxiredoxin [unclassified Sphingomonas]|uniref:peroxiredoxin n=1 Tax=unclassified Sphingomonas TaxID=196159 RepID=UPI0006F9B215|nr:MULTISPECIES: peroxiredoxin [unclassified Sphingomonas]KQM64744.1 alkyl hydroperoxide reductase [Sphingomonas sp. Leaf16]KQN16877.1 alkyl hydroperoxide reductase [Sphingomonas sp. Leaf29]KQN22858.1 alkyl hydroperoxide reductase [Sphingomonas sp. Leaf32]
MEIGDSLPHGHLTSADGTRFALAGRIGQPMVVYFYPKADTTGCTREAQDFSALEQDFRARGATVIAVSRDTPAKLTRFATKHALTVELASDEDGSVCEVFGTWVEKQMYGRSYMGIERATFLFDATGKLVRQWRKVKVPGHAVEVLAAVPA